MADNFCTACGNRLAGTARFCANCGTPVGGKIEEKGQSPVGDSQLFERLGIKVRAPGAIQGPEAQQKVWGVASSDLNEMLSCSLMNAPMDTDFLLVQNQQQQWSKWIPLAFIENMQGLKALCSGMALYAITGSSCPSLRDCYRSPVPEQVRDALLQAEKQPYIQLEVLPFFKPQDYGKVDKLIRGRWMTTVDDRQTYDVVTVAPLTPSGFIMKQRLREHEAHLKQWLAGTNDSSVKQFLTKLLEVVRAAINAIPDGFADHILCFAHAVDNGQVQSTALTDEQAEAAAPAVKAIAFKEIAGVAAAKGALLKHELTRTDLRRPSIGAPYIKNIVPFRR